MIWITLAVIVWCLVRVHRADQQVEFLVVEFEHYKRSIDKDLARLGGEAAAIGRVIGRPRLRLIKQKENE